MGRFNWSQAVAGKVNTGKGGGGGFVSRFEYEMGTLQRVVIPALVNEDGTKEPIIFQQPVHTIERGTFTLQGPKGGSFTPFQIRCMNPLSQTDPDLTKEIAESKQFCVPCLIASLSDKEYFAELEKTFGSLDEYKLASKEEKKAFNDKMKGRPQVRASYDREKRKNTYTMEMLLLVLETETKKVRSSLGIESEESVVILDEQGLPKYKPVLFKVSESRLDKFANAVSSALKNRTLSEERLFPIVEGDNQVLTSFVDFELEFPVKDSKMKSAAEMTIRAVHNDDSVVNAEFVEAVQAKSTELADKSQKAFVNNNKALGKFTKDEYVNALTDGGERYEYLKATYFDASDKEFIQKVFRAASGESGVFDKKNETSAANIKAEATATPETAVAKPVVSTDIISDSDDLLNV